MNCAFYNKIYLLYYNKMNNLILITSVINTPNIPLSYSHIRSVFSHQERFEQTKKTIQSIKDKIPNCKILLTECSDFDIDTETYLKNNVDYYLNLYSNEQLRNKIYNHSKSLGEGTITIESLKFIMAHNLQFDNFFKISGRYWLSENFNYDNFNNTYNIFKKLNNNINNICTSLYKLNYIEISKLYQYLINNEHNMINCIGYEILFGIFVQELNNNIIFYDMLGVNGNIAVDTFSQIPNCF